MTGMLRRGTPLNPAIGQRVHMTRRQRKWTQKQLADEIGASLTVITRLETGQQSVSAERIATIAEALEVSADYLLGLPRRDCADA